MILGDGFQFTNEISLAFVDEGDFLFDAPVLVLDLSLDSRGDNGSVIHTFLIP